MCWNIILCWCYSRMSRDFLIFSWLLQYFFLFSYYCLCGIMQQNTNCKFLLCEILLGNKPYLIVSLTFFTLLLTTYTCMSLYTLNYWLNCILRKGALWTFWRGNSDSELKQFLTLYFHLIKFVNIKILCLSFFSKNNIMSL